MAHEVTTSIEIAATPETVWAVLSDLASYPRWHPVFLSVTGQLAVGGKLTITTTHPTSGRTITGKVKVRAAEPGRELRWVSKLAGMTISERVFTLNPAAARHRAGAVPDLPGTWRPAWRPPHAHGAQPHREPPSRRSTRPSSPQAEARQRASG